MWRSVLLATLVNFSVSLFSIYWQSLTSAEVRSAAILCHYQTGSFREWWLALVENAHDALSGSTVGFSGGDETAMAPTGTVTTQQPQALFCLRLLLTTIV
jgi:hypothetical protein